MSELPVGPKVHELAEKVAGDALATDNQEFRLDCFKALSQFFIGMTRVGAKVREDDEEETVRESVPQMRARIDAAQNQQTPVRRKWQNGARDKTRSH